MQIKDSVTDAVDKAKDFSEPLLTAAADGVAKAKEGLSSVAQKAAGLFGLGSKKDADAASEL